MLFADQVLILSPPSASSAPNLQTYQRTI